MLQPRPQVLLEPAHHQVVVPGGLGEETLHPSGGYAHRLRQVLSVAPVPGLHQQGLEILMTAFPRFTTAKQRTEVSVKILKGTAHLPQSRRINHLAPTSRGLR